MKMVENVAFWNENFIYIFIKVSMWEFFTIF